MVSKTKTKAESQRRRRVAALPRQRLRVPRAGLHEQVVKRPLKIAIAKIKAEFDRSPRLHALAGQ